MYEHTWVKKKTCVPDFILETHIRATSKILTITDLSHVIFTIHVQVTDHLFKKHHTPQITHSHQNLSRSASRSRS